MSDTDIQQNALCNKIGGNMYNKYELGILMAENPDTEALTLLGYRLSAMQKERADMVKRNIEAGLELKSLTRQLLDLHDAFVALRKEKEVLELKLKEYEDSGRG